MQESDRPRQQDEVATSGPLVLWSRRVITAFWTTAVLTWVWAMPGSPFGLSEDDYNARVAAALLLSAATTVTAAAALLLRTRIRHGDATLRRLAFYDSLTGLANRALVLDRLEHALLRTSRQKEPIALLYLDLDQFKLVNDRLGHAAGDQLLAEFAGRLNRCVRAGDTVGRLGGDEFIIVLESVHDSTDAVQIAKRILAELAVPFVCEGRETFISASIGISIAGGGIPSEVAQVLREADAALYGAKAKGPGQWLVAGELGKADNAA